MSQGKLTPFSVREEIQRLRWIEGLSIRAVSKIVGVSRGVVLRYAPRDKKPRSMTNLDSIDRMMRAELPSGYRLRLVRPDRQNGLKASRTYLFVTGNISGILYGSECQILDDHWAEFGDDFALDRFRDAVNRIQQLRAKPISSTRCAP